MPIVELASNHIQKCRAFAGLAPQDKGYLAQRRQDNRSKKVQKDELAGKLGEVAVWVYRGSRDSEKPDFRIGGEARSFGGDVGVHAVKSQWNWAGKKWGYSWTVQRSPNPDKYIINCSDPDILFYGCLVGKIKKAGDGVKVNVAVEMPLVHARSYFDDPKLKKHIGGKYVIYAYKIQKDYRI